jgi:hypothetical protein
LKTNLLKLYSFDKNKIIKKKKNLSNLKCCQAQDFSWKAARLFSIMLLKLLDGNIYKGFKVSIVKAW